MSDTPTVEEARSAEEAAESRPAGEAEERAEPRRLAGAGPDSVLRATNLVKRYGKRRVVDDVSLEVHPGEVVGLLGPNGAGKTTTFYMIVGLIRHSRGRILLDGQEITHKPMYKRARMGIGYLSQEPSVFRKLTVEQNIRAILETCGLSRKERRERLEHLLDELGLRRVRGTKAYALSGGERRRLEITRALVTEPRYMLLDEPFAGVDPIAVDDLQSIVSSLRERGLGILITDHNVRETLEITDRAYLLYDGRILQSGDAAALINDPEARRLYLGEDFRL
jgi:lipopolysaccharide export system ATP-binding protein